MLKGMRTVSGIPSIADFVNPSLDAGTESVQVHAVQDHGAPWSEGPPPSKPLLGRTRVADDGVGHPGGPVIEVDPVAFEEKISGVVDDFHWKTPACETRKDVHARGITVQKVHAPFMNRASDNADAAADGP